MLMFIRILHELNNPILNETWQNLSLSFAANESLLQNVYLDVNFSLASTPVNYEYYIFFKSDD